MLTLFFGIVIVLVLLMLVLLVSRENQREAHLARQTLAYPDVVPAPPSTGVVNGVDTANMPAHIHDEDRAVMTAMARPDDFSSSVDPTNLSKGTTGLDSGYPGFEANRASMFADKDA